MMRVRIFRFSLPRWTGAEDDDDGGDNGGGYRTGLEFERQWELKIDNSGG